MNNLTVEEGRVVVHLPDGDVYWLAVGTEWCTGEAEYALDAPVKRVI